MILPPLVSSCLDCFMKTLAHELKVTRRNNLVTYFSCPCGCMWSRFYRGEFYSLPQGELMQLQTTLSTPENNQGEA